jgi:hypothetical protein
MTRQTRTPRQTKKSTEDAKEVFKMNEERINELLDSIPEDEGVDVDDLPEGEYTMEDLKSLGVVDSDDDQIENDNIRQSEDDTEIVGSMPRLREPEYRAKLVKVTTAAGGKSLCNGDPIALQLQGKSLDEVYEVGALFLEVTVDALKEKYSHLNPGQQRMNIGNRMRGLIKKRDREAAELMKDTVE